MPKMLKILSMLLLLPACFVLGLHAGPKVATTYRTWFPPPQYTTGDHAALYRKAGQPVVMYATTTCPYCAKARALFAARGVAYIEYQIDASKAANDDFIARGGRGVPLLYIGDRRIQGFREAAIVDALAAMRRAE